MSMSIRRFAFACAATLTFTPAFACLNGPPLQTTAVPALPGRVVFQGVDSNLGTQLYLFDFVSKAQQEISATWGLKSLINAQFSPDAKFIVFAAMNAAQTIEDVYVWPLGAAAPQNLTNGGASRTAKSEDPKWRPDEKAIVFKQNGNIYVMTVTITGTTVKVTGTTALTTNGVNGTATEASAPYYTPDSKYVYFTRNSGTSEVVHVMLAGSGQASESAFNDNSNYAYYPTVRDYSTIMYTGHLTPTGPYDQILWQSPLLTGATVHSAEFNDCASDNSDPAPVDTDFLLYSDDNPSLSAGGGWRPLLGAWATPRAWDLSRIGLGAGVGSPILGMNYTAVR